MSLSHIRCCLAAGMLLVPVLRASADDPVMALSHGNKVAYAAFSPDGTTVIAGGNEPNVRIWDVVTGRQRGFLKVAPQGVLGVAFAPDGKTMATAEANGPARLWDAATGKELF